MIGARSDLFCTATKPNVRPMRATIKTDDCRSNRIEQSPSRHTVDNPDRENE
jgi:hypothetical protein